MVMAYIDHVRASQTNVEKITLLSKERLVPFYERCGFTCFGPSNVILGWFLLKVCFALKISVIMLTVVQCQH